MGDTPQEPQNRFTPGGKILIGLAVATLVGGLGFIHNATNVSHISDSPSAGVQSTESTEPEADALVDTSVSLVEPTPEAPSETAPSPAAEPEPEPAKPASNCNPNYSGCVPNSSDDLDCADIKQRVTVTGTDVYRLDADHDGVGCESY